MPAIEVRGLEKRFGRHAALAGVDLEVAPGTVTALVGRNGAGKSTLIRILATAVLPDAGTAMVQGHEVRRDSLAVRRQIGLALGEDRSFFWRLSGRRNLEFFARLRGLRAAALCDAVDRSLHAVELEGVADRRVDGYSTGMRSRLGIARALLGMPPVLLLDEPTRSLDPVAANGLRSLMRRLVADGRTSVLLATHDLDEAAELGAQVVALSAGRVVARQRRPADPSALAACLAERT